MRRSERVAILVRALVDRPGEVVPLARFCEWFGAARSTVSEDVALVREAFERFGLGCVETLPGAGGGVRYRPRWPRERVESFLAELAATLGQPDRVLAGGFLYVTDIVFSPTWTERIGEVFAERPPGWGGNPPLRLRLNGIDLLDEPAEDVVRLLRGLGHEVVALPGRRRVPGLGLVLHERDRREAADGRFAGASLTPPAA